MEAVWKGFVESSGANQMGRKLFAGGFYGEELIISVKHNTGRPMQKNGDAESCQPTGRGRLWPGGDLRLS